VALLSAEKAALQLALAGIVILSSTHPALLGLVFAKVPLFSSQSFLVLGMQGACMLRDIPRKHGMLLGQFVVGIRLIHVS
jgi:hypothetical protein